MIMTLPNFIVIGAYKSGTTSLYNYLRQHPQIFMSRIKEPNFFAHEKKAGMMREEGKEVRVIDNMDSYQDLFKGVTNEKAIGEASPIYLGTPLAAQRIKETIPDVKLIAILRQPVDAFYSDHNMRIRESRKLANDFRERFKEIENRIRSGAISGPMYYSQLKTYYDLFDASQIRVFLFEDLLKNSSAVFQDIFRFIGVDDTFRPDMSQTYNPGGLPKNQKLGEILTNLLKKKKLLSKVPFVRNALLRLQNANTVKFPPLSPDLRRELTSIFREDIQNLQKLIGRDMTAWLN
jgi:hypothetical protein